jgi:hypothetical protein
MGWRDRVKKSFAYSAYIAEGVQNSKKQEKERKEGFQTTFKHLTQNTQITQIRPEPKKTSKVKVEGQKQDPARWDDHPGPSPATIRQQTEPTIQAKKHSKVKNQTIVEQDYSQPPPGCSSEYAALWRRAWVLADWIDDSNGAPIEDRRARLVELNQMRAELVKLEQSGALVTGDKSAPAKPSNNNGVWVPWEPINGGKQITPEQCPARCKRSGKCYGMAYFQAKPGKAMECQPDECKWIPK